VFGDLKEGAAMRFDLLNEYGSVYRGAATTSSMPDERGGFGERNPTPRRDHWFSSLATLGLGVAAFFGALRLLPMK
jgi:hypothetical protein